MALVYGSEGWGFESLRARPGHWPLPTPGRGLFVPVGAMLGATAAGSGPNSAWLMAAATASPLSPQQISLSYRHPTAARTRLPRQPLSSSGPPRSMVARWRRTGMADHAGTGTA